MLNRRADYQKNYQAVYSQMRQGQVYLVFIGKIQVCWMYPSSRNFRVFSRSVLIVFCEREQYEPLDLFDEVKPHINLIGGTLSVDDTVAEKPYSDPKGNKLIEYFWSGNQHRPVKEINLITLYYTDLTGKSTAPHLRK
ncbi:MAG: hypothetical protein AB4426_30325 [Xenococcaceae cyanobacterium]